MADTISNINYNMYIVHGACIFWINKNGFEDEVIKKM